MPDLATIITASIGAVCAGLTILLPRILSSVSNTPQATDIALIKGRLENGGPHDMDILLLLNRISQSQEHTSQVLERLVDKLDNIKAA